MTSEPAPAFAVGREPEADPVSVREVTFTSVDPDEWDRFVLAADGSFMGAWKVVRAHRLRRRVRLFEFVVREPSGSDLKVGQCAVAVGRGRVQFLDRLHVRPSHERLWDRCFQLVAERCGPATYEYGSLWNHEARRPFPGSEGLVIEHVSHGPLQIDRVDFGQWADFGVYRRRISENIRRDYKKAAATSARVVTRHGLSALRDLAAFVRLRRHVMDRTQTRVSALVDAVRHALKLICLGQDAFIATVRTGRRCHSVFFGVRFGDNIYYLSGGTRNNADGFGSYLFLTLLERWFNEHPGGKLYLGSYEGSWDPETYTGGNLLYRRKLRATSTNGAQFSVTVARGTARASAQRAWNGLVQCLGAVQLLLASGPLAAL